MLDIVLLLVTDVLVVVLEMPGPEKVYDFMLLPEPAEQPATLIVILFLPCTNMFLLVPSLVVIFTGSNVIVPTDGTILLGTFTVKDFVI